MRLLRLSALSLAILLLASSAFALVPRAVFNELGAATW
jgi:hypothetical protein